MDRDTVLVPYDHETLGQLENQTVLHTPDSESPPLGWPVKYPLPVLYPDLKAQFNQASSKALVCGIILMLTERQVNKAALT